MQVSQILIVASLPDRAEVVTGVKVVAHPHRHLVQVSVLDFQRLPPRSEQVIHVLSDPLIGTHQNDPTPTSGAGGVHDPAGKHALDGIP